MIIGIDASRLSCNTPTGVERYTIELLRELVHCVPSSHSVVLYTATSLTLPFSLPEQWSVRVLSWPPKRLWTQARLSWEMFRRPPDVLFVPAHVPPFFAPRRVVLTIHDIASEHIVGVYSWFERVYARCILRRALRKHYELLVPSEHTKQDIVSFAQQCGIAQARITVTPLGIYASVFSSDISFDFLDVTTPYVLCVGRIETKKNTHKVVEIFSALCHTYPALTHSLVLVGKPGFGYDEVLHAIAESPVKQRIQVREWVVDAVLGALYRHAALTVQLSAYEGFGLTVLESLVAGTPVLVSSHGSLSDFSHLPVQFTNPDNTKMAVEDVYTAITQPKDIQGVAEKIQKEYSWKRTAEITAGVLCVQ